MLILQFLILDCFAQIQKKVFTDMILSLFFAMDLLPFISVHGEVLMEKILELTILIQQNFSFQVSFSLINNVQLNETELVLTVCY